MPKFRVKSASVIHETINDEAVVVNLDSGTYFSLEGVASFVWAALVGGQASEAVAEALATHYATRASDVAQQLRGLTDQLLLYDLLTEADAKIEAGAVSNALAPMPVALPPMSVDAAALPGMQLHVYRDMEELLMLDPIHDVTAAGWPHTPPKS